MRRFPTLQEVGFFSYLGCLYLGAIQWPWSFALTLGLVQNSLDQTVWVSRFVWFQKTQFWSRLNLLNVCFYWTACLLFFWLENWKENPVCMSIFLVDNMQFLV